MRDADGPDGLQLAEALWLAASRRPAQIASEDIGEGEPTTDPPVEQRSKDSPPPIEQPTGDGRTLPEAESPRAGLGLPGESEIGGPATSFLSPSARAVGDLSQLARALRPLRRTIVDPFSKVLDTEATIERFAHAALRDRQARLNPVLKPARRRAWELVLLVDRVLDIAPPTHLILEEIARELKEMLRWQGAFRVVLAPWLKQEGREVTSEPLERLASPTRDRLFVVLTDMRTSAWASGSAFLYLGKLARRAPVSVWHVLPEDLWRRSAAGAPRWLATNARAGSINGSWRVRARPGIHVPRPGDATPEGFVDLALPIASLDPESLSRWARFIAGDGRVELPALRLRVSRTPRPDPPLLETDPFTTPEATPADERLSAFLDLASPMAQRLAALCAGVPLTLPILRLVQQAFLPGSPPSLASEVLMSSLLEPKGTDRYVWRKGVAEELVLRASVPDTLEVRRRIGEFLGASKETMARFEALALTPDQTAGGPDLAQLDHTELFAYVSAATLQRLGYIQPRKPAETVTVEVVERSPCILVIGSAVKSAALSKSILIACNAVGELLASRRYSLVTCGWQGVDETVADRYLEFWRSSGPNDQAELIHVLRVGRRESLRVNPNVIVRVKDQHSTMKRSVAISDAVVVIGGRTGSYNVFEEAVKQGKPVFPVIGTGGVTSKVYEFLLENWNDSSYPRLSRSGFISLIEHGEKSEIGFFESLKSFLMVIFGEVGYFCPKLTRYKAQMVSIPGGAFARGSDDYEDESNGGTVVLSPFRMGRAPVTVAMYREFCEQINREMPAAPTDNLWKGSWDDVPDHPMVNVSWDDCKAYADWAGLQLPTEAQWEYAARGRNEDWKYPWGKRFERRQLWCSDGQLASCKGTASVSRTVNISHSGCGLLDMAGNVWEWCADWHEPYRGDEIDPSGPRSGTSRVLRGGSWVNSDPVYFRCAYRLRVTPDRRDDDLGFRLSSPGP